MEEDAENLPKTVLRKIRNRKSAQESRDRKRKHLDIIESENQELKAENESLKRRLTTIEREQAKLLEQFDEIKRLLHANAGGKDSARLVATPSTSVSNSPTSLMTTSPMSITAELEDDYLEAYLSDKSYSEEDNAQWTMKNSLEFDMSKDMRFPMSGNDILEDILNKSDESTVGSSTIQKNITMPAPILLGVFALHDDPFLGDESPQHQDDFFFPQDIISSRFDANLDSLFDSDKELFAAYTNIDLDGIHSVY